MVYDFNNPPNKTNAVNSNKAAGKEVSNSTEGVTFEQKLTQLMQLSQEVKQNIMEFNIALDKLSKKIINNQNTETDMLPQNGIVSGQIMHIEDDPYLDEDEELDYSTDDDIFMSSGSEDSTFD